MPASPEDLIAFLESLGVGAETVEHPPLHTLRRAGACVGRFQAAIRRTCS
jgi:hypothetical protein